MDDIDRLFRLYHEPVARYLTRRLGDREMKRGATHGSVVISRRFASTWNVGGLRAKFVELVQRLLTICERASRATCGTWER